MFSGVTIGVGTGRVAHLWKVRGRGNVEKKERRKRAGRVKKRRKGREKKGKKNLKKKIKEGGKEKREIEKGNRKIIFLTSPTFDCSPIVTPLHILLSLILFTRNMEHNASFSNRVVQCIVVFENVFV